MNESTPPHAVGAETEARDLTRETDAFQLRMVRRTAATSFACASFLLLCWLVLPLFYLFERLSLVGLAIVASAGWLVHRGLAELGTRGGTNAHGAAPSSTSNLVATTANIEHAPEAHVPVGHQFVAACGILISMQTASMLPAFFTASLMLEGSSVEEARLWVIRTACWLAIVALGCACAYGPVVAVHGLIKRRSWFSRPLYIAGLVWLTVALAGIIAAVNSWW